MTLQAAMYASHQKLGEIGASNAIWLEYITASETATQVAPLG